MTRLILAVRRSPAGFYNHLPLTLLDTTDGVVVFLILSAATEVTAMACACMPIVGPQAIKEYKRHHHPSYHQGSKLSKLSFSGLRSRQRDDQVALNGVESTSLRNGTENARKNPAGGMIWVENEIEVTIGDGEQEVNRSITSTAHAI
jgi:hypothetical protein